MGQSISRELRLYITSSDTRQVKLSSEHTNFGIRNYNSIR